MKNLLQDLRFALRQIRRSPGFAITAVLTLALGIAANVIVFGILQALILRPIDVPNPDQVMTLARTDQTYPIFSYPEVRDVREATNEMAATIRKVIRDLDPSVPIEESSAWSNQLGLTFFVSQVATVALGIFGAFGLLLSIAGTFGLASYTVSKRLRELSIRVALGAQAKQILSAALGRMLILLTSGCVIGLVLGAATSRFLSAIVYQASALDPFVLVAVALTMALTATLSVAVPVRRALHIDPANLLREQ